MDAYTRLSIEANRCRADAQACKGCMTMPTILGRAVRDRLAERAEDFRPVQATSPAARRDKRCCPLRRKITANAVGGAPAEPARLLAAREHADLARREDCSFDTGLEH